MTNPSAKSPRPARALLKRLLGNRDGIAAVEFAYIAPVILLMMVGAMEVARAINMDRRLSTVTSMTGDLISREKDMGTNPVTTITGISRIIEHVMWPYDPASLRVEILPVMGFGANGSDTRLYAPSYVFENGTVTVDRARCTAETLTSGLVGQGGSVIVVRATYDYAASSFATWAFSDATWSDSSTHSPRHACVDFENNNCVVTCN